MSEKLEIRKSCQIKRVGFWVIDAPDIFHYVHPDGTMGSYIDYPTKADAQIAVDLYETKSKFPLESRVEKKLYGHPRFYEILKQMEELHSRKNHDYAGTSDPLKNLRACKRLELEPFMGVMVRLQDKWSRLEEFIKSGTLMVKSESVIDTLMDNAIYSVLGIILYEEQQKARQGEIKYVGG